MALKSLPMSGPRMPTETRRVDILLIFAVALAARLLYAFLAVPDPNAALINGDGSTYQQYAVNLLEYGRYFANNGDRIYRYPGYPLFLALIYRFFGHASVRPVEIIQCLIGAMACVALYAAAAKLYGRRWGLSCGLAAGTFYYELIQPSAVVLRESVSSSVVCFILALWFLFPSRPRLQAVGAALLWAAGTLVREEFGLLAVLFFALAPRLSKAWRLRHSVLGAALFLMILSPWPIRNYFLFHRFIPFTSSGTGARYDGLRAPLQDIGDMPIVKNEPPPTSLYTELALTAYFDRRFKAVFRATPAWKIARAYALNFLTIWYPFQPEYDWTYVLFVPLWLLALWRWRPHPELRVLWLLIAAYLLPHAFFGHDSLRFREPIAGALLLAATAGARDAWLAWGSAFRVGMLGWAAVNIAILFYAVEVRSAALSIKSALLGNRWWTSSASHQTHPASGNGKRWRPGLSSKLGGNGGV